MNNIQINYKVDLDAFMKYQEYVVNNGLDPENEKNRKKKDRIIILVMVGLDALLMLIVALFVPIDRNAKLTIMIASVIGVFYALFLHLKNSKDNYWKDYHQKFESAAKSSIFKDTSELQRRIAFTDNQIIINKGNSKEKYEYADIVKLTIEEHYLIVFFKQHSGTIIDLKYVQNNDLKRFKENLLE